MSVDINGEYVFSQKGWVFIRKSWKRFSFRIEWKLTVSQEEEWVLERHITTIL